MKKLIVLLLAAVMCLSLAACGGSTEDNSKTSDSGESNSQSGSLEAGNSEVSDVSGSESDNTTSNDGESSAVLTVGETAHGDICDITVTSVECVDKIENGLEFNMWSPAEQTSYEDVFADTGYSIIKIGYHVDYTGKETGRFSIGLELDYDDGYIFTADANHLVPATESGVGFEKTYTFFTDNSFTVEDALSYEGEDVDVNAYVGKEITFSFVYGDDHAVDAYIVE